MTVSYTHLDTVAVVPKDSPYKSYAELDKEGVTVGALGASTYAEVGKKMLPKATLKEFSGGSAPVGQALSTGRLDAGLMSLSTANQFLVDFGNLRVLDGVMVLSLIHICIMTLQGAWYKLRTDPILKFMVTALSFYGMATFEGSMMSIRTVNALSHYTDSVSYTHLDVYKRQVK